MQVFLQIVAFSLQTNGSGQPVMKKRKAPLVFALVHNSVVTMRIKEL